MIRELFENYVETRDQLTADLYWLSSRTKLNLGEPGDDITQWGLWLKQLEPCADFMNDQGFDSVYQRTQERHRKLVFIEWMIRSRPKPEREILRMMYVEQRTWDETAERLLLSTSTISRLRQRALSGLEAFAQEAASLDGSVSFET